MSNNKEAPFRFSEVLAHMRGTYIGNLSIICQMAEDIDPEVAMATLKEFVAGLRNVASSGTNPTQLALNVSWWNLVDWASLVELYILTKWGKYDEARELAKLLKQKIDHSLLPFLADIVGEIPFG
jgi:hypothetical protein